ncbi:MAG: VCBS repeat-containing protein [Candidatus Diapherotrites archaeon]|nr:VCBS repeat-containing protein [Candidatus Diapherotrites archaeon]
MKKSTLFNISSILTIAFAFLLTPLALADYTVESSEYSISITNLSDPGSTPLDPTGNPSGQATNTYYQTGAEHTIKLNTTTPTTTHLDPTSAPSGKANNTYYQTGAEHTIKLNTTSTPTTTHLDPTGNPSNIAETNFYVLGMEYTMSITPQTPPNIATDATTSPSDKSRFAHNVKWLIEGDISAGTTKYFLIYFDDLEDGEMLQPSYSIPLITGPNEFFLISTHDQGDITMFKSNGDGTFLTEYVGRFGPRGWGLAINDFNEDGLMDFVSGEDLGSTTAIKIHLQNAGNTFDAPVQIGTINSDWGAMDMATADFNNDTHADFIASGNDNNLHLFTGDGTGNFTDTAIPGPGSYLRAKDTADFNKDGNMDFAITRYNSGYLYVMLGDGTGSFTTHYIEDIGDDPYQATAADFDEDTNPDIVSCEGGGGRMWFHKGNGDGTFQPRTQLLTNGTPFDINHHCPGDNFDFDHDGHQDLVFTNYNGEHAYYMPGNGDGTFGAYVDLGAVDRHGNSRALIMGISAPPTNENPALTITLDTIQEFTGGYSIYVTECLGKPTNPPATVYAYQNGQLIQTVETDSDGHAFLPVEPGTYDIKACLTIDTVEKCNWKYNVNLNG